MLKKIKIALLLGGISGEREVSLKTGEQIYNALSKDKYTVYKYDPKYDLRKFFIKAIDKKFDLVFPALHGPFGEDGKLQGMLDMINMPYIFSGCLASALAMNKAKTNIIAKSFGILVADNIILEKNKNFDLDFVVNKLSLPVAVKPVELGSSVGVTIVKTKKDLKEGIKTAFNYGHKIMVEKFIKGRELTVSIIGNKNNFQVLPIIEIIPKISEFYDYKAKYQTGGSEHICPAKIPDKIRNNIQDLAIKIFKAIGCNDLARADFIWSNDDNKIYFIELNTIPGMTKTSLAPEAAKTAGMEFSQFLDKLIAGAIKN